MQKFAGKSLQDIRIEDIDASIVADDTTEVKGLLHCDDIDRELVGSAEEEVANSSGKEDRSRRKEKGSASGSNEEDHSKAPKSRIFMMSIATRKLAKVLTSIADYFLQIFYSQQTLNLSFTVSTLLN